jgi:hypothetical protein
VHGPHEGATGFGPPERSRREDALASRVTGSTSPRVRWTASSRVPVVLGVPIDTEESC